MNTVNTPQKRSAMASTYHDRRNSMFVHGGCGPDDVSELWELRFADWTWYQHTKSMDIACHSHRMCMANDMLYLHLQNNLYQYDPYLEQYKIVSVSGLPIPSSTDGIMVYHAFMRKIFLHGGETRRVATLYQIDVPYAAKYQWNLVLFKQLQHYADINVTF